MKSKAEKRLTKGKGYQGPDYAGCCNTGRAIVILHSRFGVYIVGPASTIDYVRERLIFDKTGGHRKQITSSGTAWIFKTGSTAWAKFHELNQSVLDYNEKKRAEFNHLQSKARKGDMGSILTLGLEY